MSYNFFSFVNIILGVAKAVFLVKLAGIIRDTMPLFSCENNLCALYGNVVKCKASILFIFILILVPQTEHLSG